MTIVLDLVTFQDIHIKVEIKQTNVLFTNMDCVATLQGKSCNQTYVRESRCFTIYNILIN
jgi:hypothetical protein